MSRNARHPCRHLVLVLGDQLDAHSAAFDGFDGFDGFDSARDVVWMAEVAEESSHVWSHQARIALFLAASRAAAWLLAQYLARVSFASVLNFTLWCLNS